jgi:hypothetical protein
MLNCTVPYASRHHAKASWHKISTHKCILNWSKNVDIQITLNVFFMTLSLSLVSLVSSNWLWPWSCVELLLNHIVNPQCSLAHQVTPNRVAHPSLALLSQFLPRKVHFHLFCTHRTIPLNLTKSWHKGNPSQYSQPFSGVLDSSYLKWGCGLVLTSWWAISNCNLVLNCVGSPRHFLRRCLQDGKHNPSLEFSKEVPIVTFSWTDGVLLEVCNQKERCCD